MDALGRGMADDSMAFQIVYANAARSEVTALRAFDRQRVLATIDALLRHQPTEVSRSRIKAMAQPFWSQFRLRVEEFRVSFDVDEASQIVHILHVRRKTTDSTPEELP